MNRLVLMVMPHLNVRASIRALRLATRDFATDDAVMALPEGIVLGWFEAQRDVVPERIQLALAKLESVLSGALPDSFSFSSALRESGRWHLKLDSAIDAEGTRSSLGAFALDATLEWRDPPALYPEEPLGGIALGSAGESASPPPLSFKKYELVIYLAELPETPLSGFQFSAIARVHHKMRQGSAGRTLRSD